MGRSRRLAWGGALACLLVPGCGPADVEEEEGWSAPERVSDDPGEEVLDASAAAHSAGVHLVWSQRSSDVTMLRARHLDVGTQQWGPTHEFGLVDVAPDVAADSAGNAVVVWSNDVECEVEVDEFVRAARYDFEKKRWSEPVVLDVGAAPRVAMRADGSALAVWTHYGARFHSYAAHMSSDGTWSRPEPIDTTQELTSLQTDVVVHADGDATVFMVQRVKNADGPWGGQLAAARYSSEEGEWSQPVSLQRATWEESFDVRLAGNARGDAVLFWSFGARDSRELRAVHTASYDEPSGAWTVAERSMEAEMDDEGRDSRVHAHPEQRPSEVSAILRETGDAFGAEKRPTFEGFSGLGLVGVPDVGVLAYGATDEGLVTSWHP